MGKRYVLPIPITAKKVKFDEDTVQSSDLVDDNFRLSKDLVVNTVVTDICKKKWRIGKPIGRGSFGEIYIVSNDVNNPVSDNAEYVIKVEPHSSGPLFAEINCLVRVGRITEDCNPAPGVPIYIASGSHTFLNKRYRFMIIPRYRIDLHYLLQRHCVSMKNILIIAIQILDILEYIHSKGFTHSDIKAQNLMIGIEKKYHNSQDEISPNETSQAATEHLRSVHTRMCNPFRRCRGKNIHTPVRNISRTLRVKKVVNYQESSDDESDYSSIIDEELYDDENNIEVPRSSDIERVFLIDYGLASKFIDSKGVHRTFYIDERRAHDGTLEYTSRDAHLGAHSRRSDLECLGYNLLDWATGDLPWKEENILMQPELVHRMKVCFMNNIKQMMDYTYNGKYPRFVRDYLEYVYDLDYTEDPDYDYCRNIFLTEYKRLGFTPHNMKLEFSMDSRINDLQLKIEKPSLQNLTAYNSLSARINDESVYKRYSPKNLRSKQPEPRFKNLRRKGMKSFSWNDLLSNTAENLLQEQREEASGDDIDSNSSSNDDCIRYEGKPTYAIKLVLKSMRESRMNKKGKCDDRKSNDGLNDLDGLTYAMKIVLDKKSIRENKENINKLKQSIKMTQKAGDGKFSKKTSKSSKHPKQILQNNQDVKSFVNELKTSKCIKFVTIHKITHSDALDVSDRGNVRLRRNKKRTVPINFKLNKKDEKSPKRLSYSKSTGMRRRPDQTKR